MMTGEFRVFATLRRQQVTTPSYLNVVHTWPGEPAHHYVGYTSDLGRHMALQDIPNTSVDGSAACTLEVAEHHLMGLDIVQGLERQVDTQWAEVARQRLALLGSPPGEPPRVVGHRC